MWTNLRMRLRWRAMAFAIVCVPMTSVSKKTVSSAIERVTCDSAAKWTT